MKFKGNIAVQERFGSRLYLYTAEFGHETFGVLQHALDVGREYWGDERFLTRIIFTTLEMTDIDTVDGFGISTFLAENELPIFVVDVGNRRVLLEEGQMFASCPCLGLSWGFDEFLKLEDDPRVAYLEGMLDETK
jgi:hypothetical protein